MKSGRKRWKPCLNNQFNAPPSPVATAQNKASPLYPRHSSHSTASTQDSASKSRSPRNVNQDSSQRKASGMARPKAFARAPSNATTAPGRRTATASARKTSKACSAAQAALASIMSENG